MSKKKSYTLQTVGFEILYMIMGAITFSSDDGHVDFGQICFLVLSNEKIQ